MDRRQFVLAVLCGAMMPSLASAQEPGRVYRIAVISPSETAVELMRNLTLPELARLGFVVGRNLTMTTHVGLPARMPELAREAIATKPDVVVAVSTVAILAAKQASSTVPIVMSFIGEDPIAKGLADTFARPGSQRDWRRDDGSPVGRETCVVAARDCADGAPNCDPDRPPASPCRRRRRGSARGQRAWARDRRVLCR